MKRIASTEKIKFMCFTAAKYIKIAHLGIEARKQYFDIPLYLKHEYWNGAASGVITSLVELFGIFPSKIYDGSKLVAIRFYGDDFDEVINLDSIEI